MKITGGALRGRTVPVRPRPGIRPTGARVREALFSILGQALDGASVLDPFGGTGLLSFEALSRGAERALIIERDGAAARQIREAAAALGLAERVRVRRGSTPRALPQDRYALILLDPPYAMDPGPILSAVAPLAAGRIALEHAARVPAPQVDGLAQSLHRRYGDTALTVYLAEPPLARRGPAGGS